MAGAVNIKFGAIISGFSAGIGTMVGNIQNLSRELNTNLAASYARTDREQRQFDRGLGRLGTNLQTAGKGFAVAAAGLALIGGTSFKTFANIESLQLGLQNITGSALAAGARFGELREVAKLPGLGFEEAIQGDVRLQAVGFSAKTSKEALLQFGNALATTGGGKFELNSVLTQLTQMGSKARVLSEDLKPILTASPAVAKAIKELFGTVDSEQISAKLQAAGQGPQQFIEILIAKLAQLPRVSGGAKNALENLGDSVTLAKASFGKAADESLGLTSKINALSDTLTGAADGFEGMGTGAKTAVFAVGGLATVVGSLALPVGTIITYLPQITKGLALARVGFASLLGPIGLVVLAAGAAGVALYELTRPLVEVGTVSQTLADINNSVTKSIATEKATLDRLLSTAQNELISKKEREKAIEAINRLSPEYLGNLTLENINSKAATDAIYKHGEAIRFRALARAQESKLTDLYLKRDEAATIPVSEFEKKVPRVRVGQGGLAEIVTPLQIKALAQSQKNELLLSFDEQINAVFNAQSINERRAGRRGIVIEPPTLEIKPYADLGGDTELKKAKDRLKELRALIFEGNKKGIDTSALKAEALALKTQIDAVGGGLKGLKDIVKNAPEETTYFDYVSERLKAFKEQAASFSARGLAIPDFVAQSVAYYTKQVEEAERATKNLAPVDLGKNLKPILSDRIVESAAYAEGSIKSLLAPFTALGGVADIVAERARQGFSAIKNLGDQAYISAVKSFGTLGFYQKQIEDIQTAIGKLSLKNLAIDPDATEKLAEYVGQVEKVTKAQREAAEAAAYKAEKDRVSELPLMFKVGPIKVFNDSKEKLPGIIRETEMAVSEALRSFAITSFEGMGEAIGGLIAGTNGIEALPGVLLSSLGGLLTELGKIAIEAAAGIAAIQFSLVNFTPVGALAAGVALIALGSVVKNQAKKIGTPGGVALESGGLLTGPTWALMGESKKARAGGGEFVASVDLGANLIGDRIFNNLKRMEVKTPSMDKANFTPRSQEVMVSGDFRLDGNDLYLSLARTSKLREVYG